MPLASICYVAWSSQPDIQFYCDSIFDVVGWHRPDLPLLPTEVYRSDTDRLYTYNKNCVTCKRCLVTLELDTKTL